MNYLVLSEVAKKQEYIFKSNRLIENIGASLIIKHITEELPIEFLKDGKVVFQGGGKNLYLFQEESSAKKFISDLSTKILKSYPGIEFYITMSEFNLEKDDVIESIDLIYEKLNKKKNRRSNFVGQISFGIERVCSSTGAPATSYDNLENTYVCDEINSKICMVQANKDKETFIKGMKFPTNIDKFIKNDEKSYLSIVHVDGNKMGSIFKKLKEQYNNEKFSSVAIKNNKYIESVRMLSEDIKKIYECAFESITNSAVDENGNISIRPLILAGDDITFICNSGIAIKLSKIFLDHISNSPINLNKVKVNISACAGIVFCKNNYPFSKAYALAEQLCKNCKNYLVNNFSKSYDTCSMMDWHLVQGELSQSLEEIRSEHYKIGNTELNMRPIFINLNDKFNNYENFKNSFEVVRENRIARSKVKELREAYTLGRDYVKIFIDVNNTVDSNNISLNNVLDYLGDVRLDEGYYGETAAFFDAIEVMDLVKEV